MGRVEPGGEPCAEVDQRGRISPDRPLDRGSAALSARDKSADMPASYGGSSEEQGFGCRPSPCGKYRLLASAICARAAANSLVNLSANRPARVVEHRNMMVPSPGAIVCNAPPCASITVLSWLTVKSGPS